MAKLIKVIFLLLILGLLCFPAMQAWMKIIHEPPLDGAFAGKEMPIFSRANWMLGSYQAQMDSWLEENIGFHNTLVRLNNQLDYSVFHKANAEGVIRGKGGQLYEYDYIRAWMGEDFVGEKLLDLKLRQLRFLQQYLKDSLDIELLLVLEPGKASVYPEDIPGRYKKAEAGFSNYDFIKRRSEELEMKFIDFNDYFIKIRDTILYPVFPLQGTHWSDFAIWYATDSLLNYIEEVRNINLPEVICDSVVISDSLRYTDYDMGTTLNLLFELKHGPMPYPSIHFLEDSTHQKPNVLAVADSYYWNIYNKLVPEILFNNEDFWYFYNRIYSKPWWEWEGKTIDSINIKQEIEKQDIILLMMTERFMYKFDRGFVDDLYGLYGMNSSLNVMPRYITKIVNLDSWFNKLIVEAKEKDISLGELLEQNAQYMFWEGNQEAYYSYFGPKRIMDDIRNDPEWFAQVKERAEKNNISLEERLYVEARYLLSQKYPEALKKFEGIQAIKETILSDSASYNHICKKAALHFMTGEEMLQAEAEEIYMMNSQEKKQ